MAAGFALDPASVGMPALKAELARLNFALKSRAGRNPWGSADAADAELRLLVQRRRAIVEELKLRTAETEPDARDR